MNARFFILYDKVFNRRNDGLHTEIGGVQRYLYELTKLIKGCGCEVVVVQDGAEDEILEYEDITVWCVPFRTGKRRIFSNLRKKFLFDKKADVLIWGADTISIPLRGVRTISIQHGIGFDLITPDSALKRLLVNAGCVGIYRWLQRVKALRQFRNAQLRVCVDYNYLNWYRTFYRDDNTIFVIPNFCNYEVDLQSADRQESTITIGFARRFVEKRGVGLFLSAARDILSLYSDVRFVIAGDGPLAPDVERFITYYPDKIIHTKFSQPETYKFHRGLDIAVVPSLGSEGTSLSLLEAMGAGCSVLATNVGGMTNIVVDQFNGILISPNKADLVAALRKLIDDKELRLSLGERAIDTVKYGFSHDLWKAKWLQLIEMVRDEVR